MLDELAARVAEKKSDPYSAVEELLRKPGNLASLKFERAPFLRLALPKLLKSNHLA